MCPSVIRAILQSTDFEVDAYDAIKSDREAGCFVDTWQNPQTEHLGEAMSSCVSSRGTVDRKVTTWNCRGLSNSLPYIRALLWWMAQVFGQ